MPLFLDEDLVSAQPGDEVTIVGAEARHAIAVRRVRIGESVRVGNARGLIVDGSVASVASERLTVAVSRVTHHRPESPELILVQALAKGGRDEMAIQAATELGVAAIVPWQAERSVPVWQKSKSERGRERWESIAREAAKQSERPYLPAVYPLASTSDLSAHATQWVLAVLDPTASARLTEEVRSNLLSVTKPLALVVGPEGGISAREMDVLVGAGAHRVRLGSTVLRTSTAGPAAMAVLNANLGRW